MKQRNVTGQITNNLRDTEKCTIVKAVAEEQIFTSELLKKKENNFKINLRDNCGIITK